MRQESLLFTRVGNELFCSGVKLCGQGFSDVRLRFLGC